MSGDTLSDLLRSVRLRGAVFYDFDGHAPWVAEAPRAVEIAHHILPGVEHLLEFHGVARGSCWAGLVGEERIRLETGDLVLFPRGDAHAISSEPTLRAAGVDLSLYAAPRPPQLPFSLLLSSSGCALAAPDAGHTGQTTVICGFVGCDARPFNPLLEALPRMLHLPSHVTARSAWLSGFIRLAADESNRRQPGGEAVLERMTEMMFVEALRLHVASLPEGRTGWLAGLHDPTVGRVLSLMHARPSEPWTLERLAEAAALSRSTLHERFVQIVGQPPMQYLTQWRMQLAAGRLRDTDAKVLEVALDVGYESEAAFARAFKRSTGSSPGAWRRTRRGTPARRATR